MAYEIQILITEKDIEGLQDVLIVEEESYDTYNLIREEIPKKMVWSQVYAFGWQASKNSRDIQTNDLEKAQQTLKRFRQDWPEQTYRLLEVIDEA